MDSVKLKINDLETEAPAGSMILEAARLAGIEIPTLCYFKDASPVGACRMCVVEVAGKPNLMPACATAISPGMEIWTESPSVLDSRRRTLDLICSHHRMACEYCVRYKDCELHELVRHYGLDDRKYTAAFALPEEDSSSDHLVRDYSKCVLCRRCVSACERQATNVIGVFHRGVNTRISAPLPLNDTSCVSCGRCIAACPTGALREKDDTRQVWKAIRNRDKHVIAAVSPFVGGRLGEYFPEAGDAYTERKMVALLRRIGFRKVFGMAAGFDAAAEAESALLEKGLKGGAALPMISSNCPAAVRFIEYYYPELGGNLSGCKSPRDSFAGLCKAEYAAQTGVDPKNIVLVAIDACTAAKSERRRPGAAVDVSLTSDELAAMIDQACVSRFTTLQVWKSLPEEDCDCFPGSDVDAEAICGDNGSIRQAVLRRTGRGVARAVTVSGLADAATLLNAVEAGDVDYDYIEILACPGGCLNGGGQHRLPGGLQTSVAEASSFA